MLPIGKFKLDSMSTALKCRPGSSTLLVDRTRAGKRESSVHVLRRQRRSLAQVPKEPPDVLGSLMLPESPAGTSV